jgi:hypothetical protein
MLIFVPLGRLAEPARRISRKWRLQIPEGITMWTGAIKPYWRLLHLGTWLVLTAATSAFAQTSTPHTPPSIKSTVRSEIWRGEQAGSQCSLKARDNYVFFVGCMIGEEHSYQTSDPFFLGLFLVALARADILNEDSSWVGIWQREVARIVKEYKLTGSYLCASVEMKCENVKRIVGGAY